jgi:hypothetical protein
VQFQPARTGRGQGSGQEVNDVVITRVQSWSTRENKRSEKEMSNLQDRLDEFRNAFESGVPPYNAPHEAIERCIVPQPS